MIDDDDRLYNAEQSSAMNRVCTCRIARSLNAWPQVASAEKGTCSHRLPVMGHKNLQTRTLA